MTRFRGLAALVGLGLALPAAAPVQAAELGFWGLSAEGRLQLGYAGSEDISTGVFSGDATLALPLAYGVGLELGAFGMAFDADTPHETYGTLSWTTGAFTVAAGVPRPAYDSVATSPAERLAPLIGLSAPEVAATRSRMTWGAMYGHYLPYGARISGQTGALDWALSSHRAQDVSATSAGAAWDNGLFRVSGAIEGVSDGTLGGKAGVSGDIGAVTAGVAGYAPPTPGYANLAEGFLSWHAGERTTFSALVQVPSGEGDGSSLGVLAAERSLGRGGRFVASLTAEDGDPGASLGIDWSF